LVKIIIYMARDIRIQNTCDHRLLGEVLSLGSDVMTLSPEFPIATKATVVLYRFGEEVSPQRYTLKQDKQLTYGNKYYTILLNEPELYAGAVYTMDYSTYINYCPKCLGVGFVDDIAEDAPGAVKTLSGTALLSQSVEKAIITTIGTNKYYSWVGSGISTLLGSKISDVQVLLGEIESRAQNALGSLKRIQIKHQEANPEVSGDEVIGTVEMIRATQDPSDPSVINLFVQYTSQSGAALDYRQILELTQYRAR